VDLEAQPGRREGLRTRSALAWLLLAMAAACPGRAEQTAAPAGAPSAAATGDLIEQAWREPAASLDERVERTRRAAQEAGVWSLDPAARALLRAPGRPVARAAAAARLAPDLPAARMAHARALWMLGDSPLAALREAWEALRAFSRHVEAALWLAGSGLAVLAAGLVVGGLLAIIGAGALAAPHAAHDLGDALGGAAPAFARIAAVAALVCAPALLGEGVLGLAIGVLVLAALYSGWRERAALAGAAAAVWIGAFPLATLAGRSLEALERDPLARAVLAVDHGDPSAVDLALLRAAGAQGGSPGREPLAERALARLERRSDRLDEADLRYQRLLLDQGADAALVNDAASLRLRLGRVDSALELYQRSLALESAPAVLFNFSQANARTFEVEAMTQALERAQALDPELVAELAQAQGAAGSRDFVVDLPTPARSLWERLARAGDGLALAAEARAPLAPGRLGRAPGLALAALAAPLALAALAGPSLRRSRWCARCGRRTCPRCDGDADGRGICKGCERLFFHPDQTQRELRVARIAALERRRRRLERAALAAAFAIPGAVGFVALRPVRGLLACVLFAIAAAALAWRNGVVPDPEVAGAAGPAALLLLAAAAALAYALVVSSALAARRGSA
jgi:tetratricopeptide (TPR) repeat protein